MRRQLGTGDRTRLDRYLDNVREIERRIQAVEAHNRSGETRELPEAPAGVPDSFSEHMKLMFDLQVLALQTDMTRVISFKTGRDAQNRVFPESGSNQPFHPASHHGNREERIMEFNKICKFRVGQLPYFLEKMKTTMDGDASLLDKTMIIWGSPMADPNIHNHRRCPLVLFGHANGGLKGNLHLKAPDGTPMANVMLTLLHQLGLDDMKSFGDSTGEFSLSAPADQRGVNKLGHEDTKTRRHVQRIRAFSGLASRSRGAVCTASTCMRAVALDRRCSAPRRRPPRSPTRRCGAIARRAHAAQAGRRRQRARRATA